MQLGLFLCIGCIFIQGLQYLITNKPYHSVKDGMVYYTGLLKSEK